MEIVLGLLKGAVERAYFDSQFQFLSEAQRKELIPGTATHPEAWYIPKDMIDSTVQRLMPPMSSERLKQMFSTGIDADRVWELAEMKGYGFRWLHEDEIEE